VKFHRVEGKLPAGVTLQVAARHDRPPKFPFGDMFDIEHLTDSIMRYASNTPTKFTLDVPENAATAAADVLRAMADELAGAK
jgi:hypothetical protein